MFAFLASSSASSCNCLLLRTLRSNCYSVALAFCAHKSATSLASVFSSSSSIADTVTELNVPMSLVHLVTITFLGGSCFWVYVFHFPKTLAKPDYCSIHNGGHGSILQLGPAEEWQSTLRTLLPALSFHTFRPPKIHSIFNLCYKTCACVWQHQLHRPILGTHG